MNTTTQAGNVAAVLVLTMEAATGSGAAPYWVNAAPLRRVVRTRRVAGALADGTDAEGLAEAIVEATARWSWSELAELATVAAFAQSFSGLMGNAPRIWQAFSRDDLRIDAAGSIVSAMVRHGWAPRDL